MSVGKTQWGVGGTGNVQQTHTHTHTHSAPMIHRVDGASGKDRTQS